MKKDVVILGGGLAGFHCARACGQGGLRTVLIEEENLGGTGLYSGCLPVKYLLDRVRMGWEPKDKARIFSDCEERMEEQSKKLGCALEKAKVEVLFGSPEILGPSTLEISGEILEFSRLVIATGKAPYVPFPVTASKERVLTHKEAVKMKEIPSSLVILGGEVEGLEFASLFSALGTRVSVLEMADAFLERMDADLVYPLWEKLKEKGVTLVSKTKVIGIEDFGRGVRVKTEGGRDFEADYAYVALTRRKVLPKGLETTGALTYDVLNPLAKTIFAIGDVNERLEMGHGALQQGLQLASHFIHGTPMSLDYDTIPSVMFTIPQIGGAGLGEKELKKQGIPYTKYEISLQDTFRGVSLGKDPSFLKILVGEDEVVKGAFVCGEDISELTNVLGLLVSQGFTLSAIKKHLWVHPTFSEAILQATLSD